MAAKVLVLVEHEGGAVREVTWELLGLAHRLAGEAGFAAAEITAVIAGAGAGPMAQEVAARGAAVVIALDGKAVENYTAEGYARALEPLVRAESPELLLVAHTPNGWDLAPYLAAGLGVPMVTECSGIAAEGGKLVFSRKAFNGKFAQAVDLGGSRPMIATVQRGASAAFAGKTAGAVRTIPAAVSDGDLRTRFIEVKKGEAGAVDLTQAPIIVAGGRGIGAAEKLQVIRDLAAALGGQVGASRPVTDMGWLPHEHQIGSSGITVTPKLYIAAGISGAIQHTVGMRGSGYVVAFNKDAEAPIFGVADVGVVGDLFEYVPALTRAIREAKGQG